MAKPLPLSYYQNDDVVFLAKDVIGKKICTNINGQFTSAIITETEAYCGRNDKACHANNGKRTNRTEVMFQQGGKAYVYLCYGIHNLFNITTNIDGLADAILVRAVQPLEGKEIMLQRRNKTVFDKTLTSGPGVLSKALGIDRSLYAASLVGPNIWLEETSEKISNKQIVETTRIGVDYAGEDALRPWRFYLKNSEWVSKY